MLPSMPGARKVWNLGLWWRASDSRSRQRPHCGCCCVGCVWRLLTDSRMDLAGEHSHTRFAIYVSSSPARPVPRPPPTRFKDPDDDRKKQRAQRFNIVSERGRRGLGLTTEQLGQCRIDGTFIAAACQDKTAPA